MARISVIEEVRGDLVAEALDGEDGFDGVLARDEIFRIAVQLCRRWE